MSAKRKLLCVVMDGVGHTDNPFGNAVMAAQTPNLATLQANAPYMLLNAHGTYVGLPSDKDIGNSEVGHNALGAGQIYDQGAKLADHAITSGEVFKGDVWCESVQQVCQSDACLHFIGLLSDGNVHSHEEHLYAMLRRAKQDGVAKARVHVLFDGRDVAEKSAEIYLQRLGEVMQALRSDAFDVAIASGGGRMQVTMDRYEADWSIVEQGWQAHVHGQADRKFSSAEDAVAAFRQDAKLVDQNFPAFVVVDSGGKPVGTIQNHDAVIFFNFRGDRAIEISQAFIQEDFSHFERGAVPEVLYAGMMQYDGDLKIPPRYLVSPPKIQNVLSETLLRHKVRQFACSETQKYGHVTYFWNGNNSGYLDKDFETYIEIPSDNISFDQKPAMKAQEITAATIKAIQQGDFNFGRINFPNGDMVGHTGNYQAAVTAVETVDHYLGELVRVCQQENVILLVTADHGNADEMFDAAVADHPDWQENWERITPKTSHTLNQVPFHIYDPLAPKYEWNKVEKPGLGHVANTVLTLMGLPVEKDYLPSLIKPL